MLSIIIKNWWTIQRDYKNNKKKERKRMYTAKVIKVIKFVIKVNSKFIKQMLSIQRWQQKKWINMRFAKKCDEKEKKAAKLNADLSSRQG